MVGPPGSHIVVVVNDMQNFSHHNGRTLGACKKEELNSALLDLLAAVAGNNNPKKSSMGSS